jgi:hypothetical protein
MSTNLFMNFQGSDFMPRAAGRQAVLAAGVDGLVGARSLVLGEAKVVVASKVDALALPALVDAERPEVVVCKENVV